MRVDDEALVASSDGARRGPVCAVVVGGDERSPPRSTADWDDRVLRG